MLSASNRLQKSADINRVYKRGIYGSAEGFFSVKAAPGKSSVSRLVVVVGKKVDKRAVVRNRIRRRLLGIVRDNWATVPGGYDIVISVHRDISDLDGVSLRRLLLLGFKHARVTST